MIAAETETGGPPSATTALVERAEQQREAMADLRRRLDLVRAVARETQAQLWRPDEVQHRTHELSQATEKECALSRELVRCSRELAETTRQILAAWRAAREERPNDDRESAAAN